MLTQRREAAAACLLTPLMTLQSTRARATPRSRSENVQIAPRVLCEGRRSLFNSGNRMRDISMSSSNQNVLTQVELTRGGRAGIYTDEAAAPTKT
jgi:hypothetical protein